MRECTFALLDHSCREGAEPPGARTVRLYERSCLLANAIGCDSRGFSYQRRAGVPEHANRVEELRLKTCTLGLKSAWAKD